ncbi:unnamed protein product [Lampetra fluviatilis]
MAEAAPKSGGEERGEMAWRAADVPKRPGRSSAWSSQGGLEDVPEGRPLEDTACVHQFVGDLPDITIKKQMSYR